MQGVQQTDDQLSSALRLQSVHLLNDYSTAQPSDLSECDSVVVLVEEEQSVPPQPVVMQSTSRPQSACSNEPPNVHHEQQLSDTEDDTALPTHHEEEDSALILSPEAQQLAVEILHHSLTTLDQPDTEEATELITAVSPSAMETQHDNEVLNKEASCQTIDTLSSPDTAQTGSQLETQSDVNDDSTVHKTTSKIFVDLSRLQESPSSD